MGEKGTTENEMVGWHHQLDGHGFDHWVRKIPLEKEMATHFSILAWRIPWTEEPGRLQSKGAQSVRHN